MIDIPFDQYQRYKNTQIIIESIRKSGEKFKILEVGANSHRNLEKFLPEDNVTYLDITLPQELLNDPQYILGDATRMTFDDNTYDIVIALDVYEHIPKGKRENFIKEIYRVCRNNAIISAPFNKEEVIAAEERANCFFKTISGSNHVWLIEHIENGLPSLDGLIEYLDMNNIHYSHFSHGNLVTWEKLTNMHLSTVVFGKMIEYKDKIDNYYNSFVFQNDYDKRGYRDFFVFNKSREYIHHHESKADISNQLNQLENNFYNLLKMTEHKIFKKYELQYDDTLKLYIDYGSGFNEEQILTELMDVNNGKIMRFNLENKEVKAVRIDPTEFAGKFILQDLTIINDKQEKIENYSISSNSSFSEGDLSYFVSTDPQYIIQFDKANISKVQFKIEKVKGNSTFDSVCNEVINKLNSVIIDKDDKIESMNKINNGLLQKQHELNNKIIELQNELNKKLSVKITRRIKRVFK